MCIRYISIDIESEHFAKTKCCFLNNETLTAKIHLSFSRVQQPYIFFPISSCESSLRIRLLLLGEYIKNSNFCTYSILNSFEKESRIPLKKTRICSKCNADYEPKHFAYSLLAELEDDGQAFLAACLHCNPISDKSQAPRECKACGKLKERKEFSLERQRHSTLAIR